MQTTTSANPQVSDPHLNITSEPASTRKKWLPAVATYVALGALVVVASRLLGVSWQKISTIGGLVLVFSVLGILSAVYNWVGEWIDKGFKYYFVFLGWMLVAFGPIFIIGYLNRGIVTLPRNTTSRHLPSLGRVVGVFRVAGGNRTKTSTAIQAARVKDWPIHSCRVLLQSPNDRDYFLFLDNLCASP